MIQTMQTGNSLEEVVEEQLSHISNHYDRMRAVAMMMGNPDLSAADRKYLTDLSQELIDESEDMSHTDGLTGAGNRKYFDQEMERQVKAVRRNSERYGVQENKSLTLLMIDIDNFKKYNDTNGHYVGDAALKGVVETLKKYSRESLVFRYGGEELAVLMPETTPKEAMKAAQRLNNAIQTETDVTASIGVANYTAHVKDLYSMVVDNVTSMYGTGGNSKPVFEKEVGSVVKELIEKADSALYRAKHNGKNTAELYSSAFESQVMAA